MIRSFLLLLLVVALPGVTARAAFDWPGAGVVAQPAGTAAGAATQQALHSSPRALLDSAARARPDPSAEAGPAVTALRSEVDRMLRRAGWPADHWAVLVVSLDRGDTLYAHAAGRRFAPASNMKLFTSAAGLYYLGAEYRFGTYLVSDAPIRGGVLTGDLIVYGTGDPTLSDRFYEGKLAVWEALADSLAALGIREIRGDIVGDGSYFNGQPTGLGWQLDYMNAWYAAPAGALSFNDNMVTLHILPASEPGRRPEVRFIPGGRGIALVNLALTTGGNTRIHVDRASYAGPIVVEGQISPHDSGVWRSVPVADPARYAATVLREVLDEHGIRVTGAVRSNYDPARSPVTRRRIFAPVFDEVRTIRTLAVHRSPPLLEILEVINKDSHNFYAEQVLRAVGRVALGDGSVHGGAQAVQHLLASEAGVDSLSLRMLDGSGLSVLNRVDPGTVVALLGYMARSPFWDSFWATLPEAGTSDGLRRMYGTDAEHNLRAKTGTINHVSALSGYVRAADGERLAFSIISNGVPSTWQAKRVEDAIGARLASFSRPPVAAPVVGVTTSGVVGAAAAPAVGVPATASGVGAAERAAGTDTTARVPAVRPTPAAPAPQPSSAPQVHVIRAGDTLEAIANRYGTTVQALIDANPGVEPRRLIPGRVLQLP